MPQGESLASIAFDLIKPPIARRFESFDRELPIIGPNPALQWQASCGLRSRLRTLRRIDPADIAVGPAVHDVDRASARIAEHVDRIVHHFELHHGHRHGLRAHGGRTLGDDERCVILGQFLFRGAVDMTVRFASTSANPLSRPRA